MLRSRGRSDSDAPIICVSTIKWAETNPNGTPITAPPSEDDDIRPHFRLHAGLSQLSCRVVAESTYFRESRHLL